ncbi:hypothetical protein [Acidovorax sp. Root568]|uniref:hypothetical protein n=1 Tax=Acidovorax sp. Root568 TaxID=1736565 RepID=UPI000AB8C658|nr:hypothetical protein [Acidovorax sp. Root568]
MANILLSVNLVSTWIKIVAEVVLSGVASEYVLGDLADYLRNQGHRVHEIDFASFKGDAVGLLQYLSNSQCTYITSAHTNLTTMTAGMLAPLFAKHYPKYLAPLEILGILRPLRSIYIPHDLLTPFGDGNLNEYRYLDLFDHIFAPFPAPALQAVVGRQTQVHAAGWIKHAKVSPPRVPQSGTGVAGTLPGQTPTVALFISMIEHLRWRYGDQGVFEYFEPLLGPNVIVKLPAWNGVDKIENLFRKHPHCRVFSSVDNSVDLMHRADIVVCNGASSIHAEANLLGLPAICLLDDEGIAAAEQRSKLINLPHIYFHDYKSRSPLPCDLISHLLEVSGSERVSIFDYSRVEAIVSGRD